MNENEHLKWLLSQIYSDLPTKRDWLNPDIEQAILDILFKKKDSELIQDALDVIFQYGGIDGDHHKQWVLDQVVTILTGNKTEYTKWVRRFENGEDGPRTYIWDKGIAP